MSVLLWILIGIAIGVVFMYAVLISTFWPR